MRINKIIQQSKVPKTQLEIELKEVTREEVKSMKLAQNEYAKYFIVKGINEVFEQNNATGIENLLNQWIEKGNDPETIKLKEIFDRQGSVVLLKYLNNQYLKENQGCTIPRTKIKETWKHKEYLLKLRIQSKKDLKNEVRIDNKIINFVNQQSLNN